MPTQQEILDMVERKETATQLLRKRWNRDYDKHWILEPYQEEDGRGRGFRQYTSNDSRVNAKKAIGMISAAQMKIIVPQNIGDGTGGRKERDNDNAKEQFIRGNFRANDQRLIRLGERGGGPLLQQLAFYLNVRGTTVGRCLLRRRGARTIADATPWDPRDCFWEYGPDGLDWIVHRFSMMGSQAERDWKFDRKDKELEVLTVYDYYDGERNIVSIPEGKDTPVKDEVHGLLDGDGEPQTPAWVMANTLQPAISPSTSAGNTLTIDQLSSSLLDFGESIFADGRHQFETWNFITGIRLELAGRSRKPMFGIESESGVKLVQGDPFKEGAEIPLKTGEKLVVYDFLKTAGDTDALSGVVATEQQKAGFPSVSFGSLPDPVSGFAITQLKGGTADKVMGSAQAGGAALMQISDIWCDHFNTRAFDSMELSGEGRNRKWFAGFISPQDIEDLPQAQITLIPELPENVAEKVQTAIALRTPGVDGNPLESDRLIREDWLNRDDADMDADAIMQQMAVQNPLVQAMRMVDSLAKSGDIDGAMAWRDQFWIIGKQMEDALLQAGVDTSDPTAGISTEPGNAGFSPEVLPRESQGRGSPTPGVDTPFQAGPSW